jgi:hypothetical protein
VLRRFSALVHADQTRHGSGIRYGFVENAITDKMRRLSFEVYNYAPFERDLREGECLGALETRRLCGMSLS